MTDKLSNPNPLRRGASRNPAQPPSNSHSQLPSNITSPSRIGPYSLLHQLGVGGMGEVWMGRRVALSGSASKTVAIKLMSRSVSRSVDARRLFETEARLSMMLSHSNIVQVFDVGEHEGQGYLAMEWVDGVDLATVIKHVHAQGEMLSVPLAAFVIGEVLNGLTYAHGLVEAGGVETIIHRDISPHNILVSVSGEVKITDFGIARLRSEDTSGIHIRGKLRYMPPEQAAGNARAPTIDLFAVGAVLQEMLDGVGFRRDIPSDELFRAVASGAIPPLQRREVSPAITDLLSGLLEPRATRRIQSAGHALELLRRFSGYGNARAELGLLVREIAGIEGPRSGLSIEGQISADTSSITRVHTKSPSPKPTRLLPAEASVQSQTATNQHDAATAVELPTSVHSVQLSPVSLPRARRSWLLRSAAVAGFALSLLGGFALAWSSQRPAEGRELAVAPTYASENNTVRSEARGNAVAPTDAEPEPDEPEPQPSVATPTLDPNTPAPGPVRNKAKRRSSIDVPADALPASTVKFTAAEFHALELEVDGQHLSLDPYVTISLEPGRHRLEIRENATQAWRSAGTLTLEPGHHYRVEFLLSNTFRRVEQ